MLLCGPPPPVSSWKDFSCANLNSKSLRSCIVELCPISLWLVHSCKYVLCLAKQLAKADSGTCGPHKGRRPLHLVFAFCNAADSHSSRARANLKFKTRLFF